jgi:hypothetical protein
MLGDSVTHNAPNRCGGAATVAEIRPSYPQIEGLVVDFYGNSTGVVTNVPA